MMSNEEISRALADEIIAYVNKRRDAKEEAFLKAKPQKNKLGVITNGAINEQLLNVAKTISQEKSTVKEIEKSKKTKEQTSLSFQKEKYKRLVSLIKENVVDGNLFELEQRYQEFVKQNANEHNIVVWLNDWVAKAKDISFATHVGKLTHSSSKSSSILDTTFEKNDFYLTTNQLNNMEVDTASSNAASLPIADILKLKVESTSVLDCLQKGDTSLFEKLTDDDVVVRNWCNQLKQAYDSSQKQSYFLAKQVYFPIRSL